jgi:hypothetical protein
MDPLIKQWIVDKVDESMKYGSALERVMEKMQGDKLYMYHLISQSITDTDDKEKLMGLTYHIEDVLTRYWRDYAKEHEAEILEEMGDD